MKRRLIAGVLLAVPVTALAVAAVPLSAHAAAPVLQGWWTTTNPGGFTLPVAPPAPLVPPNGLLIQGGVSTPTAYAALSYDLGPGVAAGKLTLAVAPNSGTTPAAKLELCPLSGPTFSPAQGGPIADAPTYDCKTKMTAGPNAKGTAYEFTPASLMSNGTLAIAILPVDPTTRVVLSQPGDSSLETQQSAAAPPSTSFVAPPPTAAPAPAPASGGSGTAQAPVAAAPLVPANAAPSDAPTPDVATPTPTQGAVAVAASVPTNTNKGTNRVVAILVVAGLVIATLAWAFAGRGASLEPAGAVTTASSH